MSQKNPSPAAYDVRVRERNLRDGIITEKDVEKYVTQLPDLADQAEPFATSQPALAQPEMDDEEDDEDEDEDQDEPEAAAPEAAAVAPEAPSAPVIE